MQNTKLKKLLIGSCCIILLGGCAKQQDYAALQQRVQTQDQQLRQLQPGMADTWSQMQALRQELNTIKGQLDDLNRAGGASMLVDRVQRHDAALRQVETNLALNLNLDAPMGSSMHEGSYGGDEAAIATAGTMTLTPTPQPPMQMQASMSAPQDLSTTLFNAGISAFNSRNYAEALRSFNDYIKTYATGSQVGNSWFYVGESNFQLNRFNDAALAYDRVITKYPKSSRIASAYLKQGICFSKLGQKAAATARLQELIKKYPTSAEAARAKSFLKTNG